MPDDIYRQIDGLLTSGQAHPADIPAHLRFGYYSWKARRLPGYEPLPVREVKPPVPKPSLARPVASAVLPPYIALPAQEAMRMARTPERGQQVTRPQMDTAPAPSRSTLILDPSGRPYPNVTIPPRTGVEIERASEHRRHPPKKAEEKKERHVGILEGLWTVATHPEATVDEADVGQMLSAGPKRGAAEGIVAGMIRSITGRPGDPGRVRPPELHRASPFGKLEAVAEELEKGAKDTIPFALGFGIGENLLGEIAPGGSLAGALMKGGGRGLRAAHAAEEAGMRGAAATRLTWAKRAEGAKAELAAIDDFIKQTGKTPVPPKHPPITEIPPKPAPRVVKSFAPEEPAHFYELPKKPEKPEIPPRGLRRRQTTVRAERADFVEMGGILTPAEQTEMERLIATHEAGGLVDSEFERLRELEEKLTAPRLPQVEPGKAPTPATVRPPEPAITTQRLADIQPTTSAVPPRTRKLTPDQMRRQPAGFDLPPEPENYQRLADVPGFGPLPSPAMTPDAIATRQAAQASLASNLGRLEQGPPPPFRPFRPRPPEAAAPPLTAEIPTRETAPMPPKAEPEPVAEARPAEQPSAGTTPVGSAPKSPEEAFQAGRQEADQKLGAESRPYDRTLSGIASILKSAGREATPQEISNRWHNPLAGVHDEDTLPQVVRQMRAILESGVAETARGAESELQDIMGYRRHQWRLNDTWPDAEIGAGALSQTIDTAIKSAYPNVRRGTKQHAALTEQIKDGVKGEILANRVAKAKDKLEEINRHYAGEIQKEIEQLRSRGRFTDRIDDLIALGEAPDSLIINQTQELSRKFEDAAKLLDGQWQDAKKRLTDFIAETPVKQGAVTFPEETAIPIADYKPPEPIAVTAKRMLGPWFLAPVNKASWHTNTHIALKGEPLKGMVVGEEALEIHNVLKETDQAIAPVAYSLVRGERDGSSPVIWFSDGAALNRSYYDYMKHRYPNGQFRATGPANRHSVLMLYDGDQIVGAAMPMDVTPNDSVMGLIKAAGGGTVPPSKPQSSRLGRRKPGKEAGGISPEMLRSVGIGVVGGQAGWEKDDKGKWRWNAGKGLAGAVGATALGLAAGPVRSLLARRGTSGLVDLSDPAVAAVHDAIHHGDLPKPGLQGVGEWWEELQRQVWNAQQPIVHETSEASKLLGGIAPSESPHFAMLKARGRMKNALGEIRARVEPIFAGMPADTREWLDDLLAAERDIGVTLQGKRGLRNIPKGYSPHLGQTRIATDLEAIAKLKADAGRRGIDADAILAQWMEVRDWLLDYLEAGDMIRPGLADQLKQGSGIYAPFYRVFDELADQGLELSVERTGRALEVRGEGVIKPMVGSERIIKSPTASFITQIARAFDEVEKNRVGKLFVEMAEMHPDLGRLAERIPGNQMGRALPTGEGVLSVFRAGERELYKVPANIKAAFEHMSLQEMGGLSRLWTVWKDLQQAGAVVYSVGFMGGNVFRDTLSAIQNMRGTGVLNPGLIPGYDTIVSLSHMVGIGTGGRIHPEYLEFLRSGAGGSEMLARDPAKLIDRWLEPRWKKVVRFSNPLEALPRIGEMIEESTRYSVFRRTKARSLKRAPAEDARLLAMREAREASTDFAQKGSSAAVEFWSKITPFFNPQIQGQGTILRRVREEPGTMMLKHMLYFTMPTVGLWLWNRRQAGDEQQRTPSFVRNRYWRFYMPDGETVMQIPKPADVRIEINGVEMFLDWLSGHKPEALKRLTNELEEQLPPMVPPVIGTPMEQTLNRREFTNRDIVPERLRNAPLEMQVSPRTTQTAEALAGLFRRMGIGQALPILGSPARLDTLTEQVLGTAGREALVMGDIAGQRAGLYKEKPIPSYRVPLLGRFKTKVYEEGAGVPEYTAGQQLLQMARYLAEPEKLKHYIEALPDDDLARVLTATALLRLTQHPKQETGIRASVTREMKDINRLRRITRVPEIPQEALQDMFVAQFNQRFSPDERLKLYRRALRGIDQINAVKHAEEIIKFDRLIELQQNRGGGAK